jgi:hypothetical protein
MLHHVYSKHAVCNSPPGYCYCFAACMLLHVQGLQVMDSATQACLLTSSVACLIVVWLMGGMSLVHRYISNAIVYMGASKEREAGTLVVVQAVLSVVTGLEHRGHMVIVDNFFTNVALGMSLLERGFWMTGTVKKGSKGFPPSLAGLNS